MPKLGVNVDHIATIREARKTFEPSPVEAALLAQKAGCDSIVAHLREDRRHIKEPDIVEIKKFIKVPFNLEMSIASDIVSFAVKVKPDEATIVPEKRKELTTEGGLDVVRLREQLRKVVAMLQNKNIRVSLFIEPDFRQIEISKKIGVDAIEIHTGHFANAKNISEKKKCFTKIKKAVEYGLDMNLIVNAGHGLRYDNTSKIAQIRGINSLNIGHSIIAYAVIDGMKEAVVKMKKICSIETRCR